MLKIILSLLAAFVFSNPAYGQETPLPYERAPYNDTVIECGAMFAIIAEAHRREGDAEAAKGYQAKFDRLLKQAEGEFSKVGRSKTELDDLLQKRVYIVADMVEKNTQLAARIATFCNQKFSE